MSEAPTNAAAGDEVEVRVEHNAALSRYEIFVGPELVGRLDYRTGDPEGHVVPVVLVHTEIDPTCERKGLGGHLVGFALDDLRHRGASVVPECSFVAAYIRRHPEYASLVA